MADVLAFPLKRRRRADPAMDAADQYLVRQIMTHREALAREGISSDVIEIELKRRWGEAGCAELSRVAARSAGV